MTKIRAKERDALIQSLRAGVVPRLGQHLIQVGRVSEIEALVKDIERIADGGASFRLVTGAYGSGKTFFLNLIRSIAMEKKLVVAQADLAPDRRLHATGGQARSLYAELMRNLSTRSKPDGGALPGVVQKFVATAKNEAKAQGIESEQVIHAKLESLSELVNGYDFASVIAAYCRGFENGNDQLQADAIRWLRGEFSTKTDARNALGVREFVDDASVYDQLKLLARFVRLAGFGGLLINLDEMVNLYKLANTQARKANYEQILRILNDALQGNVEGLGVIMGGTPDFLMDTRRGLYSYEALQSRLANNAFAQEGLVDLTGPVMPLSSLTPEEIFLLLERIHAVFTYQDPERQLLPQEAFKAFIDHSHQRLGEAYFRTPRTTIKAFVDLLAILEQNKGASWQSLLGNINIESDADDMDLSDQSESDSDAATGSDSQHNDDNLTTFKL